MRPTLEEGDYLVALPGLRIRPGDLVTFRHPERSEMWMVKRAVEIDGTRVRVLSDNPEATLADSRTLGLIEAATMQKVILRYWPPRRFRVFSATPWPSESGTDDRG